MFRVSDPRMTGWYTVITNVAGLRPSLSICFLAAEPRDICRKRIVIGVLGSETRNIITKSIECCGYKFCGSLTLYVSYLLPLLQMFRVSDPRLFLILYWLQILRVFDPRSVPILWVQPRWQT